MDVFVPLGMLLGTVIAIALVGFAIAREREEFAERIGRLAEIQRTEKMIFDAVILAEKLHTARQAYVFDATPGNEERIRELAREWERRYGSV